MLNKIIFIMLLTLLITSCNILYVPECKVGRGIMVYYSTSKLYDLRTQGINQALCYEDLRTL